MKKLYSYHYSIMSALNHRYMRETYEIYFENDRKINIDASLRNVKYFEAVFFINISSRYKQIHYTKNEIHSYPNFISKINLQ